MDFLVKFFKENNIEYINKKFILAVSTGVDSAVLLDMFIKLKKEINIEIIVAHVNHQVRDESKVEEDYIKSYTKKNNIECFVERLEFSCNQTNFEAVAREKRYEFMFRLYDEVKADYLVLAHHGNDNVETMLMRLLRGSSLSGYSGMQELTTVNDRNIIRPFLNISKDDICKYQRENNVEYYEDITNNQRDYTRNRIRMDIVPSLFNECSDLINKFNDFRKTIYAASLTINEIRDSFIKDNVEKEESKIIISREEFRKLNEYLKQEVLFEILKEYKLSKVNINQFINIICSNKQNYQNWFKEKFMFILEYNKIIIQKVKIESKFSCIIVEECGLYNIADKKILCASEKIDKNDYKLDEIWYNSKSLPVIIRNRLDGDKIIINGKTKKIKDLFIDLKIPKIVRDELLLIVKDDIVLAVLGVIKSDNLKEIKNADIVIKLMEE